MKQQKTFVSIQRINLLGLFVSKLFLSSLIIWLMTFQSTLALPLIQAESRIVAENYLISQNLPPKNITQLVRKDLSQRTKIPFDAIKVKRTQPMTWPDGCLGLAKIDEFCTQILIQGWQISVEHKKNIWVYRTDSQGKIIRLESL